MQICNFVTLCDKSEKNKADLVRSNGAIAHLAEATIGSITSTVTCNVSAELHTIVRENLPANGGGGGEMIFGRSKT